MELTGNTIVITGGTSGIGLGLAERFLALENKVIICGRRSDRLVELARKHPGLITKLCDVSDSKHRLDFIRWIKANHPDVNVLVNNAGIQYASSLSQGLDMTRVDQEINTNILPVLHLTDLILPVLEGKKSPAILNVSSGLAFVPLAPLMVYCATKAFVHSLTLSMRLQLKSKGIEVIEIIPPSVDTELGKERRQDPASTHGGMPIEEFLNQVFVGLESQTQEIAVGMAENLRKQGESLLDQLNSRVSIDEFRS